MKGPELLAYETWLRLKGYLRLRKWEHLELIQRTPILDLLVPDINTPILRMSRYIRPWIERGEGDARRREIRAIEEILSLQKPPLTESEARNKWKGFVEKCKPPPSNRGQSRYSPNEFMEEVRPEVLRSWETTVRRRSRWYSLELR